MISDERQKRARISALLAYAIILSLWLLKIYAPIQKHLAEHTMLNASDGRSVTLIDTVHFYEAGNLADSPDTRLHIYDPAVQARWLRNYLGPQAVNDRWYAEFVPFLFPLLIPFSRLPLGSLFMVWTSLSVLAGVASIMVLAELSSISWTARLLCLVALFASLPCWNSIVVGQITLFLLLIISCFCWGFFRKNDFIGGIALALSAVKPHYALYLAIPTVVKKRWRLIAVAFVFEMVLLIGAAASIGWANVFGYPQVLMHSELGVITPAKEACVRALLSRFLPQSLAFPCSIAGWLIGFVLTVILWINAREETSMRWAMALTIMLMLLLSPHTYLYDWTLLLVSGMVLLPINGKTRSVALWKGLIISYPLLSWLVFVLFAVPGSAWDSALAINLFHFLLLALALYCFRQSCSKQLFTNH
jgi:hypothetical protein